MIVVANSNIVSAFDAKTIGAKVTNAGIFNALLIEAIERHDFRSGKTPGQAVIPVEIHDAGGVVFAGSAAMNYVLGDFVSGGVGRRTKNPNDYVAREHRGQVHLYLKREFAAAVESVRAVVYTKEAYLNDPDIFEDPNEFKRIYSLPATTHVLVAVLASAVESFVSPYRFVANLAGGNLDYAEGKMTYAELVELARKVKAFDDDWAVVADERNN